LNNDTINTNTALPHGGARWLRFHTYENDAAMQLMLFDLVTTNEDFTLTQLTAALERQSGMAVSSVWCARAMQSWGMSWAQGGRVSWRKFDLQNMQYYGEYAVDILTVPWNEVRHFRRF
jgi:hypothetical protein